MGNLKAESGIIFNKVEKLCLNRLKENGKVYTDETYTSAIDLEQISKEEFLHPLPNKQYGYGLCQWTSPNRKLGLYNLCKSKNVSIADEEAQLEWLITELKTSYLSVLSILKTTSSIQSASDAILTKFERPADTSDSVKKARATYGQTYYDKYASKISSSTGGIKMTSSQAKYYTMQLLKHYPFISCDKLAGYTTNTVPHIGDIVLFYNSGRYSHTGYVYDINNEKIYTIEGNTSGASAVISNGGGVCKKSYKITDYPKNKYFRPDYSILVNAGIFKTADDAINAITTVANNEVGYLEKASNSQLDSKTANAGSANYTKYWRDIAPEYQAQYWCACFVTWIIQKAIEGGTTSSVTATSTSTSQTTILKQGSKGDAVKTLQQNLIKLGYSVGSYGADGDFGSKTKEAVVKYQKDKGLTADGEAGPITLAAIEKDIQNLSTEYQIKVTAAALNIRAGAGTQYSITGVIRDQGTYTIIEEKNNFGKLKSGKGWISLKFTKRI
jgi:hypothetical protein